MDPGFASKIAPYALPLLVLALVARRLIRNAPRKIKLTRLFLLPGVLSIAMAMTLAQTKLPSLWWIAGFALAGALGGGVGYLTARHREFTLDAETGEITSRATPAGTIIFACLFAMRFGVKFLFPQFGGGSSYGPHPAGDLIGWTDAGLVFSAAMLVGAAVTTWVRTRTLVGQYSATGSVQPSANPNSGNPL